MDQLGFVEAVDGLRERAVVGFQRDYRQNTSMAVMKTDPPTPSMPAPESFVAVPDVAAPTELASPMIDVHEPHQTIHTWRDFFVHIATIVIGLIIAVGLEQTVERISQLHELSETRAGLAHEQLANQESWAADEHDWRRTFVELKNNLTVLEYIKHHPGTPQNALPGDLSWNQSPFIWNHAVWDATQQKGVVQRMALKEANGYVEYYAIMSGLSEQSGQAWTAINEAHSFDLLDPDPTHLSAQQLDQVIQLTLIALEKHVTFGYTFGFFAHEYPDRPHTLTWALIDKLRPTPAELDPKGMAVAHETTQARLKAANSGPQGTTISPQALR